VVDHEALIVEIARVLSAATGTQAMFVPGIRDLIENDQDFREGRGPWAQVRRSRPNSSHQAACDIAQALTDQGRTLPIDLQAYVVEVARTGRRCRTVDHGRDTIIAHAVTIACQQGKLRPTRNHARHKSKGESGCSIVSQALSRIGLHMTEDAVAKIRQRMLANLAVDSR
jgi:hypothetical protein